MFARQIAVMKGQAWNVVETLKTQDHGPLELTRRTRVCVWDDLVDIPVAIPMRVPSAEMRRRRELDLRHSEEQEEMDISAAIASAPQAQHDLLRLESPTTELPNPNRFNLSRNNSFSEFTNGTGVPAAAAMGHESVGIRTSDSDEIKPGQPTRTRPQATRSKTRASIEDGRRYSDSRRRQSFSKYGSTGLFGDTDDLEGDLGYAAAEGMENSRRKVIVERLETVKSKNPVFTWC